MHRTISTLRVRVIMTWAIYMSETSKRLQFQCISTDEITIAVYDIPKEILYSQLCNIQI